MEKRINSRVEKLYSYFFLTLPILNQYALGSVSFVMIFAVLGFVLVIFRRGILKDKNNIALPLFIYLGYSVLCTMINVCTLNINIMQVVFRLAILILIAIEIILIIPELCDFESLFKIYKSIVLILSIILILQYLLYIFTGKATELLIPGLTLNGNDITGSEYSEIAIEKLSHGWYYRPCALFLEPAHYAQYILPYIFMALINENPFSMMIDKITIILSSLSVILSASSLGIVGLVIIWLWYILRILRKHSIKDMFKFLGILGVCIIGIYIALQISSVSFYLNMKLDELLNANNESNSFTVRVLRGLECYKNFNPINQIFGCGYGNITQYIREFNISTKYDAGIKDISYMSGFFMILCSFGFVGTAIYIYTFYIKSFSGNLRQISLLVCIFLMMGTTAIFNSPVYYIMIAFYNLIFFSDRNELFLNSDDFFNDNVSGGLL